MISLSRMTSDSSADRAVLKAKVSRRRFATFNVVGVIRAAVAGLVQHGDGQRVIAGVDLVFVQFAHVQILQLCHIGRDTANPSLQADACGAASLCVISLIPVLLVCG